MQISHPVAIQDRKQTKRDQHCVHMTAKAFFVVCQFSKLTDQTHELTLRLLLKRVTARHCNMFSMCKWPKLAKKDEQQCHKVSQPNITIEGNALCILHLLCGSVMLFAFVVSHTKHARHAILLVWTHSISHRFNTLRHLTKPT